MKKLMETIWGDFDSADPVDILLLCFGYSVLALILGAGIMDWVYYVR